MKILLLDSDWPTTAYLIYELARLKFNVVCATPSGHNYRWLQGLCRHVRIPGPADRNFLEHIRQLMRTEAADIVYATCESMLYALWGLPDSECGRVFPKTTKQQRQLLSNRKQLYEYVENLGVSVPSSRSIPNDMRLDKIITELGLPCVFRGTQGCAGAQVEIVSSSETAHTAYANLKKQSPGEPFAQEYIAGRRCLIGGLFAHGETLQLFSQCTLEMCAANGPSIRVRSLRDPILNGFASRIFAALQWDGIACAEFMQTETGEYRFLEINPRPWAAVLAAHHCGVPLLRMFAQYLSGKRPRPRRSFKTGVEYTLFPAFLTARIQSGRFPHLRDARAYWQSLRAAPWHRPVLLAHYLHMLWWEFAKQRRQRIAAT